MQKASSSSRPLPRIFVLCSAFATSLLLAACGDDGTDGLASCPGRRIQADKFGVQQCAPRAGSDGATPGTSGTSSTPRGGTGSGQPPNSQQPPKPAAGSGGPPPIPKGGTWTCVQVSGTCSCQMTDAAADNCMKPLPGCCLLVREGDKYSGCVCYAENSAQCTTNKQDPATYVPVSTCPPQ